MNSNTPSSFILLGAGGHAKVLLSLGESLGINIIGVCDPELACQSISRWRGLHVLGKDEVLEDYSPSDISLINGIGKTPGNHHRKAIYEKWHKRGFVFTPLIHPTAWVADSVSLSDGVQVMAGAVVQPDCLVGINTIVNTRAAIDHDSNIGDNVHIAPGAVLCGGVIIGNDSFVSAGAIIAPGVTVGERSLIAAGTSVVRNVANDGVIMPSKERN